jgi:predicted alpha-1,6-mannanase (GH76 family)
MQISCRNVFAWMALVIVFFGRNELRAFTAADAQTTFTAYTRTFYCTENTNAYFRAGTAGGKSSFWERAEQMEMLLDVYERTTNVDCLTMFSNVFNGFTAEHGLNWAKNPYNDDIMWMTIACARGYLHTGNPIYRDAAQLNFNLCYARAWSTNLGGGLWWTTTNASKNACVNGPAAIASHLLFQVTGDSNYLAKSEIIYEWERGTLFDDNDGAVCDAISANGNIRRWSSTYNQGTFIGAANLLGYTNDALLAADYTMNHLCHDGMLPQYPQSEDLGGFNGICVRWLAKFMYERGLRSRYENWLRLNADAAWEARRKSDGLAWSRWPMPTPENLLDSWECSSAVVLLHAIAPMENTRRLQNQDRSLERTSFQTGASWGDKYNLGSDVAIVYGIDTNLPSRIATWREHGYRIHVMTGVAWGQYQDYLYGRFDGINHEDEAQMDENGSKIGHGGDVYYMCPGTNYGKFLCVGVQRALDAGAEAIHLEEPEFWDRAGYSEGFKREWKNFYGDDWQPPHSSVDARWRTGKLKYFLYRRALQQVFDYVQDYNKRTGRQVRCYVPTHSLLNYAQWCIVSPESSLAQLNGCDGYIAQVWTGTAREPNKFEGEVKSRTFETAFLEYGAMQNLVRATGRSVWYLNDPIEDNPNHDWNDYKYNWESTLTASLFQPDVWQYEVAPWPERIFNGRYPRSVPEDQRKSIPPGYATELQTVFNTLNDLKQLDVKWDCGTTGIGVIASDSMMFQRGEPTPSDPWLGNFYGLAMPLVKRGIPVTPVQLENVVIPHYLDGFKILLMSYDGQKPLTPEVHAPIADWVESGGVLLFCDADADPYLKVHDWWNSNGNNYSTPREHLFEQLRLKAVPAGKFVPVGKGGVIWLPERPANLTTSVDGAEKVVANVKLAAQSAGLAWSEKNYLLLRRGPYMVAAGLDDAIAGEPKILHGHFVNLFDPELRVLDRVTLAPGSRFFLRDLDVSKKNDDTKLLASACKAMPSVAPEKSLSFLVEGAADTAAVLLFQAMRAPKSVTLDGEELNQTEFSKKDDLLRVRFPNEARPRTLKLIF